MAGDEEQRDVRESLGDLERRLLDLERELRTDASEDATVAAGAPTPPPPSGAGAEQPASGPGLGGGGGVAAPPGPPPDIDIFAQDARAKVAALRATLDGLTHATDRLRETAQTVVEDHGRALVRLERATGTPAQIVMPAPTGPPPPPAEQPPPEPPPPPAEQPPPSPPAAPAAIHVPSRGAPPLEEPPLKELTPAEEPSAPEEPPAPEPLEAEEPATPEREPEPEEQPGTAAEQPPAAPIPPRPELPPLPWRRLLAALAVITILVVAYSLIFGGGGDDEPEKPALPTGIAATDSAITAAGGGIGAIRDLRTGVDAQVRRDLCAGRVAAAIDVVTPGGTALSCPGIRQVAAPVLVASGFARQTERGRTCVSVPSAPALDRRRREPSLTARRDEAVRLAPRERAFAAGTAFDRRNGLTLLSGAAEPGEDCIEPTAANVRSGRYPLSTRLILYSRSDTSNTGEVRRAASRLRSYYAGTPPLYAVVLD